MQKLSTLVVCPKGTNYDDLVEVHEDTFDGILKPTFKEYHIDFSEFEWEEYAPGKLGIARSAIRHICNDISDTYGPTIDIVHFIVPEKHWQNADIPIWGWHVGGFHGDYDYSVCITKRRRRYEDTGIHETMHTLNDIVRREIGASLAKAAGVGDWDRDVVHGESREYREYDYRDAVLACADLLEETFAKRSRRSRLYVSILERILNAMNRLYTVLTSRTKE